jgi:hypothetical protein
MRTFSFPNVAIISANVIVSVEMGEGTPTHLIVGNFLGALQESLAFFSGHSYLRVCQFV